MRSELLRKIIHVLAEYPETRDCDRKLMTVYYQLYYPHEHRDGWMKPGALERMTNPDDIVRLRAVVQNDKGLYLPKDADVRAKRRQRETAWTAWLLLSRNTEKLNQHILSC